MPILVIFTSRLSFRLKGEMQYYHFRSTRSVFTDLEDCDDSNMQKETEDRTMKYFLQTDLLSVRK